MLVYDLFGNNHLGSPGPTEAEGGYSSVGL